MILRYVLLLNDIYDAIALIVLNFIFKKNLFFFSYFKSIKLILKKTDLIKFDKRFDDTTNKFNK